MNGHLYQMMKSSTNRENWFGRIPRKQSNCWKKSRRVLFSYRLFIRMSSRSTRTTNVVLGSCHNKSIGQANLSNDNRPPPSKKIGGERGKKKERCGHFLGLFLRYTNFKNRVYQFQKNLVTLWVHIRLGLASSLGKSFSVEGRFPDKEQTYPRPTDAQPTYWAVVRRGWVSREQPTSGRTVDVDPVSFSEFHRA